MTMDDRTAILLAMMDLRDCPAALEVCEIWLRTFPLTPEPSFIELTQPSEK